MRVLKRKLLQVDFYTSRPESGLVMQFNQTMRFQSTSAICATLGAYIRLLKTAAGCPKGPECSKLVMSRSQHLSHKNAVTLAEVSRKGKSVDTGAAVAQEVN